MCVDMTTNPPQSGRLLELLETTSKRRQNVENGIEWGHKMELTVDAVGGLPQDGILRSPHFTARRPIDLVHLARYTLGNSASEHEILKLFRTQSKLYLDRLREAVSETAWRDAAHTIKDSACGIGAWGVAGMAETAETLDHDERAARQRQVVESLQQRIDEANGYIDSLLCDA